MATPPGSPSSGLKKRLLEESHKFSFFQVIRLLEQGLEGTAAVGGLGPLEEEAVRLKGLSSLGFPRADIYDIQEEDIPQTGGTRMAVTVPFLGLYGPDSPTAPHITEDILYSREDETAVRDFLDVFNHRLIALLYRVWGHYRLYVGCLEWGEDALSRQLAALLNLRSEATASVPVGALMPCAGLLMQRPRSAVGLTSLLRYHFPAIPIEIEQCIPRPVEVHPGQQTRLGLNNSQLGRSALLGSHVVDTTGKFRIRITLKGASQLGDFQPGGESLKRMSDLVSIWCQDELEWDLQLRLRERDVTPVTLSSGSSGSRLGVNSWLGRPSDEGMTMIVEQPRGD